MSIFGYMTRAGINVGGPGGLISFTSPVQFDAGQATNVGRGKIFYVDSVNGSANNNGKSAKQALTTFALAVAKCTANQGDVIYGLPKHTEDISGATSLVINKAGISIIGLGHGAQRPLLTFTAAASKIDITALDVKLQNIRLLSNFTNGITAGIVLGAAADGCQLIDIEMQETANTKEWKIGISIAAACHNVLIEGFKYFGIAGGDTTQVIKFVGASNYSIVRNFLIYVDATGAVIDALTAISLFMTFGNGVIHNLETGAGLSISVKSDTTGFMHDLRITALKNTVGPIGAVMSYSEVYLSNAINKQGIIQIPGVDT